MTAVSVRSPGFRLSHRFRPGFTLAELLAVIAVISILISVASVGIQNLNKGQATSSGLAVAEAVFEEARSAAVGRGTEARVLIHSNLDDEDELDRDRYLRYMCVAVPDIEEDENGESTKIWRVISRGTFLPSGVFFSPEESERAGDRVGDIGEFNRTRITLPGDRVGERECIYYEFNSEGVCVDSEGDGSSSPGAAFVLVGGARPKGQSEVRIDGDNRAGFVIWRNGRTSLYRSPKQMGDRQ